MYHELAVKTFLYHAELRWFRHTGTGLWRCHGHIQLRRDARQTQNTLEGFSILFGLRMLWIPPEGANSRARVVSRLLCQEKPRVW